MTQAFRIENGGLINRDKKLSFKFNGKTYFGYEGDTLASALLANGVHLVGRSFKYHRPRGFFGAGVDEPYAVVQLYRNGETEPNVKATEQELFEGLEAKSVNCWPSVNFDIGAPMSKFTLGQQLTLFASKPSNNSCSVALTFGSVSPFL